MAKEEVDLDVGAGSQDRISDWNIHDTLMVHGKEVVLVRIDLFQSSHLDGKIIVYEAVNRTQFILKHRIDQLTTAYLIFL